jgi:hypothetical protein
MEYSLSGCVIGGVEQMSPGYAGCAKYKRNKGLLIIFLFIIGLHVASGASVSAQDEVLSRPVVYIVNIEGTIEPGLASYVKRVDVSKLLRLKLALCHNQVSPDKTRIHHKNNEDQLGINLYKFESFQYRSPGNRRQHKSGIV